MILLPLSILRGRECLWDAEFLIAAAAGACLARIIPFIPISLQGQAGCGEAAAPQAPEMPPASPHLHQQSVPGAAAPSPWHCRTPRAHFGEGQHGGDSQSWALSLSERLQQAQLLEWKVKFSQKKGNGAFHQSIGLQWHHNATGAISLLASSEVALGSVPR